MNYSYIKMMGMSKVLTFYKDNKLMVQKLAARDSEIPIAASFDKAQDKLYTVSNKGLFCVWDLKTL